MLIAKVSETEFKNTVVDLARRYGWLVHHDLPAVNRRGRWATHVQGDSGFPDLVLVSRNGTVVFAELKTDTGNLSSNQNNWLSRLEKTSCIVEVWRPTMLSKIVELLATT